MAGDRTRFDIAIDSVSASAYRVPTPVLEADGTLPWDNTTIVVVRVSAAEAEGLGWTYAGAACVNVINDVLADTVRGTGTVQPQANWHAMQQRIRNLGRPGLVSCAMSAVDTALWDLSARLAGLPLNRMLGQVHEAVDVYGSGGFTTLSDSQLREQVERWVLELRIPRVKIKIGESWGRRLSRDLARVQFVRELVGEGTEVFVDANGGYTVGQATRVARLRRRRPTRCASRTGHTGSSTSSVGHMSGNGIPILPQRILILRPSGGPTRKPTMEWPCSTTARGARSEDWIDYEYAQ